MDRDPQDKADPPADHDGALVHEIAEALTAIAGYLATAHRLLDAEGPPRHAELRMLVGKSLGQVERMSTATHRLRRLHSAD